MTTTTKASAPRTWSPPRGLELLIPILAAIGIFAALNPNFLRPANLATILIGMAFVGIVAIGQTVVIISGNFDLSIGMTAGLCAIAGAELMSMGVPTPIALLVLVGVGVVVGLVNAFFTNLGLPSFIVTIGMLFIVQGIALFITGGQPIYPLPEELTALGRARPLGVSVPFIVMIVLLIATSLVLRYSRTGLNVYAVGGSPEVSSLLGVRPRRVVTGAFVFSGLTAALAGLLQMASLNSASNQIGVGWELTSVAAVVIGGASIFGGTGNPLGTLLGAFLLGLVSNGLVSIGVSPNWQTLAVGTIMIVAVSVDIVRRRARMRHD